MSCKTMLQLGVLLPTLICFCCCQTLTRLTGDEAGNPPGNKYFSKRTAKWLGSDSTAGDSCWLVDADSFAVINTHFNGITGPDARNNLGKLERVCIHINDSIALLLQQTRDSSALTRKEYQMLIYLDLFSGNLSAIWGPPGENHKVFYDFSQSASGYDYLPEPDHQKLHRILLAQAHGHPKPEEKDGELTPKQSDSDRCAAFKIQGPIYPVIAEDTQWGIQGQLCRVVPEDIRYHRDDLEIGSTQGYPAKDSVFNVGLDALLIYSKGKKPQNDCLPKTVKKILRDSLTTPSSLHRSL